jgi:hypothetical protein
MINIKNYSVEKLKDYYQNIKKDGLNPDAELFKQVPDVDIVLEKSGKFKSDENDIQKMLLWVICKSNIKG